MILQVLIAMIAGWINRRQQQVIDYQQEEIRILKAKLGSQRILIHWRRTPSSRSPCVSHWPKTTSISRHARHAGYPHALI